MRKNGRAWIEKWKKELAEKQRWLSIVQNKPHVLLYKELRRHRYWICKQFGMSDEEILTHPRKEVRKCYRKKRKSGF